MEGVVFDDENRMRGATSGKPQSGSSIVNFLIQKKLADNEQQAYLWVGAIVAIFFIGAIYFFSNPGSLDIIGIAGEENPTPQMSPDRYDTMYAPGATQ